MAVQLALGAPLNSSSPLRVEPTAGSLITRVISVHLVVVVVVVVFCTAGTHKLSIALISQSVRPSLVGTVR